MTPVWHPYGATVAGARHVVAGAPNQDHWAATPPGTTAVVAVADGHGSPRCPRSATGARLAAAIAVDVAARVFRPTGDPAVEMAEGVCPEVINRWRTAVAADADRNPFSHAERIKVGPEAPALAYGTTLVVVACSGSAVGALAIGDGDVVAVRPDGDPVHVLGGGAGAVGTETASLAGEDAATAARVGAAEWPLAAVWASTDGFGTAFADPHWWREVAVDLLDRVAGLPPGELAARVPEWLRGPAEVGGDDATMALLVPR